MAAAYISPPKQWEDWYDLVYAFASHLVDRYGLEEVRTWNFEGIVNLASVYHISVLKFIHFCSMERAESHLAHLLDGKYDWYAFM